MKKNNYRFMVTLLILCVSILGAKTDDFQLKTYGSLQEILKTKNAKGVVTLKDAIPPKNGYALGILANGLGQVTVIDNQVVVDYGENLIGLGVNTIPEKDQAAMLVTAVVEKWQPVEFPESVAEEKLYEFITKQAKKNGLDMKAGFPFIIEGTFDLVKISVNDGTDRDYDKPGGEGKFFSEIIQDRYNQPAYVMGFYAPKAGIYTFPGTSWHLHIVIPNGIVGAHVDYAKVRKGAVLKLPFVKK